MAEPSVNQLTKLGYPENLSDGVVHAIEFYKDIDVSRFRNSVIEALRSVLPEERLKKRREEAPEGVGKELPRPKEEGAGTKEDELHEVGVGTDEEDAVLKLIESLDSGSKGAPWDKIVEAAKGKKIDKVRLEEIVASLLDKGEIYEPELGMMKRI